MPNDLDATRELLSRQLAQAVATDAIGALPIITALQRETDEHLRDAARARHRAASWRAIAAALEVSKQAAHRRFRLYVSGVADEMKREQRAIKQARRDGDTDRARDAQARRLALAAELRKAARARRDLG